MKQLRRILAFLLALTMLCSVLPTGYAANDADGPEEQSAGGELPQTLESGSCGDNLTWSFDSDTGLFSVEGTGPMYLYDATNERPPWQSCKDSITAVSIAEGVTSLCYFAFSDCAGLEAIVLPDSVETIWNYAFRDCSALQSVTLGSGLRSIQYAAFSGCTSLTQIQLPEGLTGISEAAFSGCTGLTALEIPASVNNIQKGAFKGCSSLLAITVAEGSANYWSDGTALYKADKSELLAYPAGRVGPYTVREETTSLAEASFQQAAGLTEIHLPAGLLSVSYSAFQQCTGLQNVSFGPKLKYLLNGAFQYCENLHWVSFAGPCPTGAVASSVFSGCASNLTMRVRQFHRNSFYTTGNYAAYPIVVEDADRPYCGDDLYAEFDESTGTLTFTGSGEMYDYSAVGTTNPWKEHRDAIQTVVLPEGLTKIGKYAFCQCPNLTQIDLPEQLTKIEEGAFQGCGLSFVTLPGTLSSLGSGAFAGNPNLTGFAVAEGPTSYCVQDGVLYYNNFTSLRCYPSGRTGAFEIPASVVSVTGGAFQGAAGLTAVSFPDSLTSIAARAFQGASGLTDVSLPTGLTSIAANTFDGCAALERVTVRSNLTTLADAAFANCPSLLTVKFTGKAPTSVGTGVFSGYPAEFLVLYPAGYASSWGGQNLTSWKGYPCAMYSGGSCGTNLEYLLLNGTLRFSFPDPTKPGSMNSYSYSSSVPWSGYAVSQILLPEGLTNIGSYAFYNRSTLEEIQIPSTVSAIGSYAFQGWTALESIVLPAAVNTVSSYAFRNCSNLRSVRFLGAPPASFGSSVFQNCSSELVLYYPSEYAAQWAPNGESSWKTWPIAPWLEPVAGDCGANVHFYFDPDTRTLTLSGSGPMDDYQSAGDQPWAEFRDAIERVVAEDGVSAVGDYAFAGLSALIDVELGSGAARIGACAFEDCTALTELALPAALNSLDATAFRGCEALEAFLPADGNESFSAADGVLYSADGTRLIRWPGGKDSSFQAPDGVLEIGPDAFSGSALLRRVTLPAGCIAVGDRAFANCESLSSAAFFPGLTTLGDAAFFGCGALEYVFFLGQLPNSVGQEVFAECGGSLLILAAVDHEAGWYAPGVTEWQGVPILALHLEDQAIGRCGDTLLWGIDETGRLTVSGVGAMYERNEYDDGSYPWEEYGSMITAVKLREGVTVIPSGAFWGYETLSSISLPATLEEIGACAIHANPSLQTLTLGAGCQSFTLNDGILYTADGQELVLCLPAKTGTVIVPNGVKHVREAAFAGCAAVTELVLPDGMESLGDGAFSDCAALERIVGLGAPPETVGEGLFDGCPESLTAEPADAFLPDWDPDGDGCWCGLPILCPEPELPLNPGAGANLSWSFDAGSGILHVSGSGPMYDFDQSSPPWIGHKAQIREVWLEEGVTSIGARAFYRYPALHTLRMPDSLTAIGEKACYGCGSFECLILPPALNSLGSYAFGGCAELDNGWYRNNVIFTGNPPAQVGEKAFGAFLHGGTIDFLYENFEAWQPYFSIWHGYDTYYVDDQAGDHVYVGYYKVTGQYGYVEPGVRFAGYGDLWDLAPNNYNYTYFWDGDFVEVHLSEGISGLGDFSLCSVLNSSELQTLELPESLVRIGDYALSGGEHGLTSIRIPASVTEIGEGFLMGAQYLETITVDPANPAFKIVDGVLYSMDGTRLLRCPAGLSGDFAVPEGVTTVDHGGLWGAELDSLSLPASFAHAEKLPGCPEWAENDLNSVWRYPRLGLRCVTLTVDADNPLYTAVDNVLYDKSLETALYCPVSVGGTLTLPDSVRAIGPQAFLGCEALEAVEGLERVRSFGALAFAESGLRAASLSAALPELPAFLFLDCLELKRLTIPASVAQIGHGALLAGLETVVFQGACPSCDGSPFSYDNGSIYHSLEYPTVYYPILYASSWTAQSDDNWFGCRLLPLGADLCGQDVHWFLSDGVLSIFGQGPMEDYSVHTETPWYGSRDEIRTVQIAEGVTRLGSYAFAALPNLEYAELPEGLSAVGDFAFAACPALTELWLPESLNELGGHAFYDCPALASAFFEGLPPETVGEAVFDGAHAAFCIGFNLEHADSWRPNGDETEWHGYPLEMTYDSNQCGKRMYWEYDTSTYTLSIHGGGDMYDYGTSSSTYAPWYSSYRSVCKHIVVDEGVTGIGKYAFYNLYNVVDVSLPSTLEVIREGAFRSNEKISELNLPDGLKELGTNAFYRCYALNSLHLPANMTEIGAYAFEDCRNLPALALPAGLKRIGDGAFEGCYGINSLTLPEGLERIGAYAFTNCRGFAALEIPGSVKTIGDSAFSNCYGMTGLTLNEGLESLGNNAFSNCTGITEIQIPATLRSLGNGCFSSCSGLTGSMTVPATVENLGTGVFSGCSQLTSVEILAPLTALPNSLFNYCSKLESVGFPGTVTRIGRSCFSQCESLLSFQLPDNITEIGSAAFQGCKFSSFTVPVGVTVIESMMFEGCSELTEVIFLGPVTSIGSEVFRSCQKLEQIELPDSLRSIGSGAFQNCYKLSSIHIPEGVAAIPQNCFNYCYLLDNVVLPNSVTTIGSNAFSRCSAMTGISFGLGLQSISSNAFDNCAALTGMTFRGARPSTTSTSLLYYTPAELTVFCYAAYANSWAPNGETSWQNRTLSVIGTAVPGPAQCGANMSWSWDADAGTLTVTGSGVMNDYSPENPAPWACYAGSIQSVVIDEGVSSVGAYAFAGCTALTDLSLPSTLTSFGSHAFAWCWRLSSAVIPAEADDGADKHFGPSGRALLHQLAALSSGTPAVGESAFEGCAALSAVTIPAGTAAIGNSAFQGCSALQSVTIPESVTAIGVSAFRGCGLTGVTIPAGVQSIGMAAFQGCASLYRASFQGEPPVSVGSDVFQGSRSNFLIYYERINAELWTENNTVTTWKGFALNILDPSLCGPNLYWYFNAENGELKFNGYGPVFDFYGDDHPYPWAAFRTQITSLNLLSNVNELPARAFEGCTGLIRVTIPANVRTIGDRAFYGCSGLTEALFLGEPPAEFGAQVFTGTASGFKICCTPALAEAWAPNGETTWNGWPLARQLWHVSFLDWDGSLLSQLSLDNGSVPAAPAAPARTGYAFVGWDAGFWVYGPDELLPAAYSDRSYTAVYEKDLDDGYYLIEPDWLTDNILPERRLAPVSGEEGLWRLNLCLDQGQQLRVARVENRRIAALYPQDCLPAYTVDEAHAGEVTLSFSETEREDWTEFGGYFLVETGLRLDDGFYLIGPDWSLAAIDPARVFTPNPENQSELMLSVSLGVGDRIKVVRVENNAITGWYPDGLDTEYCVDEAHAGEVVIYFKNAWEPNWSAFGGWFWIEPVVPVHVHSVSWHEAIETSCTEPGSLAYYCCEDPDCALYGKYFADEALSVEIEDPVLPALGHDYQPGETTEPSCTESGYTSWVCSRCGVSYADNFTDPLGHLPGEPVTENYVEPTPVSEGSYDSVVFCVRCGAELSRETIILPALTHDHEWIVDGDRIVCALCGEEMPLPEGLFSLNDSVYYARDGALLGGWQEIDGSWYRFDETNKAGVHGSWANSSKVGFQFENGRLLDGAWEYTIGKYRYWYGPDYYRRNNSDSSYLEQEIHGDLYLFDDGGYRAAGLVFNRTGSILVWYDCSQDGRAVRLPEAQIVELNGKLYYVDENSESLADAGLICFRENYYYVVYDGSLKRNGDRTVPEEKTNGLLPAGTYHFDENGRMTNPPIPPVENGVDEDGYYRENGEIVPDKGLIFFEGFYYYVIYNGKIKRNGERTVTEEKANGLLPAGTYYFDADGHMTNVPVRNGVDEDGYYRENFEIVPDKGLIFFEGFYYYVIYNGKIKRDGERTVTEEKTNGLLPAGTYYFDADGHMTDVPVRNGIDEDGYYRENFEIVPNKGLVYVDGGYYYVIYNGQIKRDGDRTVTEEMSNGLLPAGLYHFGPDGRMTNVPVQNGIDADGYYRENYEIVKDKGMVLVEGKLYFVIYNGKVKKNGYRTVTAEKANGLIEPGTYYFGEDGALCPEGPAN